MKSFEARDRPPGGLSGVVILEPDPSLTGPTPSNWAQVGVGGVRVNLIGKSAPDQRSFAWTEYMAEMRRLGRRSRTPASRTGLVSPRSGRCVRNCNRLGEAWSHSRFLRNELSRLSLVRSVTRSVNTWRIHRCSMMTTLSWRAFGRSL